MKILIVDVESSPHLSWHFGRWNQNIQKMKTEEEGRVICFAARWLGQKKVHFKSEWQHGADPMLRVLWDLMDEADVIMGFNSKKFDVKMINTEFIKRGWDQPSPYDQIDLLQQVRKHFRFSSNKLDDVLKDLGLVPKLEHEGMQLWIDVQHKIKRAQKTMQAYNKHDVVVTEALYEWIKGWIKPHPNMGLYVQDLGSDNPTCPNCGGHDMTKHKKRRTRVGLYQQWHCNDCGAYARGRKNLNEGGTTNGVLV